MMTFILYIILFIVLFFVLLLGTIARLFFRVTGRANTTRTTTRTPGYDDAADRDPTRYTTGKERKKIFDADDGEYVDFEEIKE